MNSRKNENDKMDKKIRELFQNVQNEIKLSNETKERMIKELIKESKNKSEVN